MHTLPVSVCPECKEVVHQSMEDAEFNKCKLKEQSEFRGQGSMFMINLRFSCKWCGVVFVPVKLRKI